VPGVHFIELEGVRVNNLRNINLKIRHQALTVICGVSGSGKSSLAFDTLYAEGQRRYLETFSPSARQFLDRVERPAADRMMGLPPAIAIRQQIRSDGPRSTLGTRTEILDSLRILFARAGQLVCPQCGIPVEAASPEAACSQVIRRCGPGRILIVAAEPGEAANPRWQLDDLIRKGLTRAIQADKTVRLEDIRKATSEDALLVIVDRLKADGASAERLAESIGSAMSLSSGNCLVLAETDSEDSEQVVIDGSKWHQLRFSIRRVCLSCHREFPEPSPERLSFTSPLGACPSCHGTGVLNASMESRKRVRRLPSSAEIVCSDCGGSRLNRDALAVHLAGCSLPAVASLEAGDLTSWLSATMEGLSPELRIALRPASEFAQKRLRFLVDCGLSYLSLDRSMKTLSGGESQRALLTTTLGSGLINTLYVLDEPSAGLHNSDTEKIITSVRELQRCGNTVVVVEHDPNFILAADEVIEIGPGAGVEGGTLVFQGTPAELLAADSVTARKLQQWSTTRSGHRQKGLHRSRSDVRPGEPQNRSRQCDQRQSSLTTRRPRDPELWLTLRGVQSHTVKDLNVAIPLGVFCIVTGVSGSGKSSLMIDALYPALCRLLQIPCEISSNSVIQTIEGVSQIENVVRLDQSPVQRSHRSIPATWIGVFNDIRILLSETHEAKKRNYSPAMFSFNASSGGRCPVCEGRGVVTVAMQFLADIETACEECHGRRFRPDVLEARYRDRSVADILSMTTDEAFVFFSGHHRIQQRLNAARQVGLGYLRLGQPLSTISGGEAQRLRIAAMLAGIPLSAGETSAENRKAAQLARSGRTLFLLDEPSSGLHLQDIEKLLSCIDFLLQTGHSVIVIDHDESLISQADWRIEMGPGPGRRGGQVIFSQKV